MDRFALITAKEIVIKDLNQELRVVKAAYKTRRFLT